MTLLYTSQLMSQNIQLKGVTKFSFKNSKIYVTNAVNEKYYEKGKILDSSVVDRNGNFEYNSENLSINYPYKFINKDKGGYDQTSFFFIPSKNTRVKIFQLDSLYTMNNKVVNDDKREFDLFFQEIKKKYLKLYADGDDAVTKYGGVQKIPHEYFVSYKKLQDEIVADEKTGLNTFVTDHPNSNAAFWTYIDFFEKNLYNSSEAEFLLQKFSENIRQSFPATQLRQSIQRKKILTVGQKFPNLMITNVDGKPATFNISDQKKYTLVEFWFSHCLPCRRDLPNYLELYNQYEKSGFTIISIATDRTQDVSYLKKTIKDFNIPWEQYLDENGKQSKIIGVESYPTNFLLDNNYEIVRTNLSVEDLKIFLSKNFNL